MEYRDLEGERPDKIYQVEKSIDSIAHSLLLTDITDDNVSPSNSLSSLEQILLFEIGEYIGQEFPLNIASAKVVVRAWEIYYTQLQCGNTEFNNEEPVYTDPDKIILDLSSTEDGRTLQKIAYEYLAGNITDDNPSEINSLTTLEQLIHYKFLKNFDQDDKVFKILLSRIKYVVELIISTKLNGGCEVHPLLNNINLLDDEIYPRI